MIDRRLQFLVTTFLLSLVMLGYKTFNGSAATDQILLRALIVLLIVSALMWLVGAAQSLVGLIAFGVVQPCGHPANDIAQVDIADIGAEGVVAGELGNDTCVAHGQHWSALDPG